MRLLLSSWTANSDQDEDKIEKRILKSKIEFKKLNDYRTVRKTKLIISPKNNSNIASDHVNDLTKSVAKNSSKKNKNSLKNDQNQNNQKDDYNLPRIRSIPLRIGQHHKQHSHKQRKHRFNKLSSIFESSLPSPLDNKNHLENAQVTKENSKRTNQQNSELKNVNKKNSIKDQNKSKIIKNQNEFNFFNSTTFAPYLLTNSSLIKLHRKVKKRKTIRSNQFLSDSNEKRKLLFKKQTKHTDLSTGLYYYLNQFSNQKSVLNSLSQIILFLTPTTTLSTLTNTKNRLHRNTTQLNTVNYFALDSSEEELNAVDQIKNSSSHLNLINDRAYYKKASNLALGNCNESSENCFKALSLKSSNETVDNIQITHYRDDLNSLNQIKLDKVDTDNLEDPHQALEFARNLMVIIYVIIFASIIILLLRVLYIAILRKLRRPIRGTATQSQNSARHSSQLYTQNTFNPANLGYQPGANSNSNVNVSTYVRSEANSISGGTASFIGTLTGTIIAHNVQLNRSSEQDKQTIKKESDETKKTNVQNRSNSPSLMNRPFSRQSGKFTDLNIISDEFSSSVYVNEDNSNQ